GQASAGLAIAAGGGIDRAEMVEAKEGLDLPDDFATGAAGIEDLIRRLTLCWGLLCRASKNVANKSPVFTFPEDYCPQCHSRVQGMIDGEKLGAHQME
ncbi:MAG: hypothetical protein L0Z50_39545, partial [Verrucomicrobiales bacterium]|nr:hypothetical protein [Verrucomicrobiales bacterium]